MHKMSRNKRNGLTDTHTHETVRHSPFL